MKRLSILALATMVAACAPMGYPMDPYGYPGDAYPPYPPEPYPPYPPADPYPPGSGYPPPDMAEPGAAGCPIVSSSDWTAWVNSMPGPNRRPTLYVTGKVTTATGGYRVGFTDARVAESLPVQVFVRMLVYPPAGAATQVVMTQNVRWQTPVSEPIGRVVIQCGDRTLADIAPVQNAQ